MSYMLGLLPERTQFSIPPTLASLYSPPRCPIWLSIDSLSPLKRQVLPPKRPSMTVHKYSKCTAEYSDDNDNDSKNGCCQEKLMLSA